jgi:TolA-binding protein
MKYLRLAALAIAAASSCFGASKEMVELQRDVAQLQDQATRIQRTLDEKLSALQVLIEQTQQNSSQTVGALQAMPADMAARVGEQLRPVLGVGQKVDGMQQEIQGLHDSVSELSARLERIDAKLTDVSNKITLLAQPPAPPPSATGGPPISISGPPAGVNASDLYAHAQQDQQIGAFPIALKEYQDYLRYFGKTEQAPEAQFNIGQIYYNQGDMENAAQAFDAVLEQYPDNPETPNAYYMKAMSLAKAGQRQAAVDCFKDLIAKYPHTDQATKARNQLKGLGVAAPIPKRRPVN